MDWNIIFNQAASTSYMAVLVTEGITCTLHVFGWEDKGRRAYFTFIGVFLVLSFLPAYGQPGEMNLFYAVMSVAHLLQAIGIYSFVSRFFHAINGWHKNGQ